MQVNMATTKFCFCAAVLLIQFATASADGQWNNPGGWSKPNDPKWGPQVPPPFWKDFYLTFGQHVVKYPGTPTGEVGHEVELGLDKTSGSGFRSKYPYLFGRLSMNLKLAGGNSAGTVTSFYLASVFKHWCELDFEFLGNVTGEPYILQTNVFAEGKGDREQRIFLWFDPTTDFHNYGVLWNQDLILFLVDDKVIRVFHNSKDLGLPYLEYQPMYIYSSIWNGEAWATRGGRDKCDWSKAPFVASYTGFDVDACTVETGADWEIHQCYTKLFNSWYGDAAHKNLTSQQVDDLRWIKSNYIIYDYCSDTKRFNTTPPECAVNWP